MWYELGAPHNFPMRIVGDRTKVFHKVLTDAQNHNLRSHPSLHYPTKLILYWVNTKIYIKLWQKNKGYEHNTVICVIRKNSEWEWMIQLLLNCRTKLVFSSEGQTVWFSLIGFKTRHTDCIQQVPVRPKQISCVKVESVQTRHKELISNILLLRNNTLPFKPEVLLMENRCLPLVVHFSKCSNVTILIGCDIIPPWK